MADDLAINKLSSKEEKEAKVLRIFEAFKAAQIPKNKPGRNDLESSKTSRAATGTIKTFLHFLRHSKGTTLSHLMEELTLIKDVLSRTPGKSKLGIISTTEQFIRYATLPLATIETDDISHIKHCMTREGEKYLQKCEGSLEKVITLGSQIIFDGARVLIYSDSDVVIETLKGVPESIEFTVFATINREQEADSNLSKLNECKNIDLQLINDLEIAYKLESVDLILMGAEAVLKNAGIVNKVGSLALAMCSKEMNKPLYVLVESFKFSQIYPLNQSDFPMDLRCNEKGQVRVDYIPSKYLTLLITDRGLLTSTAVCEELMEIYI